MSDNSQNTTQDVIRRLLHNSRQRFKELLDLCAPIAIDHEEKPRPHWVLPVTHFKKTNDPIEAQLRAWIESNIAVLEEACVIWCVRRRNESEVAKVQQAIHTLTQVSDFLSSLEQ